ncbi:hypothetical protein [Klebsiella michiganensis]|uniref:hypothetical protein n=1 Tax=Klebsiella michiganensis TaxID=1134687 RepID=UPI001D0D8D77|nr:hypothetical protein [Klebsiella michiganensis]
MMIHFLDGDSVAPRSLPDPALISGLDSEKVIDGKEPEIETSSSHDDDGTIMVFKIKGPLWAFFSN